MKVIRVSVKCNCEKGYCKHFKRKIVLDEILIDDVTRILLKLNKHPERFSMLIRELSKSVAHKTTVNDVYKLLVEIEWFEYSQQLSYTILADKQHKELSNFQSLINDDFSDERTGFYTGGKGLSAACSQGRALFRSVKLTQAVKGDEAILTDIASGASFSSSCVITDYDRVAPSYPDVIIPMQIIYRMCEFASVIEPLRAAAESSIQTGNPIEWSQRHLNIVSR